MKTVLGPSAVAFKQWASRSRFSDLSVNNWEMCETPVHSNPECALPRNILNWCFPQASGGQAAWDAPIDAQRFWDLACKIVDALSLEPDDVVSLLLYIMSLCDPSNVPALSHNVLVRKWHKSKAPASAGPSCPSPLPNHGSSWFDCHRYLCVTCSGLHRPSRLKVGVSPSILSMSC